MVKAKKKPKYYRMDLGVIKEHLAMLMNALGSAWQDRKVGEPFLILWEPGSSTDFHEHDARGVIVGFSGEVKEDLFDVATKMPVLYRTVTHGTVCFEDSRYIQRIRNVSDKPAVTLHVFFGNGPVKMKRYTERQMRAGR